MRRQQGQSAVEFALMAPIVFMMIFGMIWGGIMFTEYIHYSNALRTAVREIAVSKTKDDKREELISAKEAWILNLWEQEVSIPFYKPHRATVKDEDGNETEVPIIKESDGDVIITVAFTVPDEVYATLPNVLKSLQFPPKTIRTMQYRMRIEGSSSNSGDDS